jgi:hypothetical protein
MPSMGRDTEQKIRSVCETVKGDSMSGYVTYFEMWNDTSWDLKGLMAAIKYMEKQGKAHRTVNRMGKGTAFKLV